MIRILQDQIDIELGKSPDNRGNVSWVSRVDFHPAKLTNKFIRHIFCNYTCYEFTEHWYDSYPDVPDDISDMAYEYSCGEIYTPENFEAYKKEQRILEEYEKSGKRLLRNNWFDVYGPGIWDMSANQVDELCHVELMEVKKGKISVKNRLFTGIDGESGNLLIYYYGRDYMRTDLWFIFSPRKKRIRKPLFKKDYR